MSPICLISDDEVIIQGTPSGIVGETFTLYDDDIVEGTMPPPKQLPYTLSGNVSIPGVNLIMTAFGETYIEPSASPAQYVDNDAPFNRNIDGVSEWHDVFGSKDLQDSFEYWVVYLLTSWQGRIDADYDPDTGNPELQFGESLDSSNKGTIYIETIRETEIVLPKLKESHVVVHEIGHQGGGAHEDGGIMAEGAPTTKDNFTDKSIKKFRQGDTF